MMLAGPPRMLSIVSALLLICFGAWYLNAIRIPLTPKFPRNRGYSVNPLDFSIPILFKEGGGKPPGSKYSRILVVPKAGDEDLKWLHDELQDVPLAIYEVDNPNTKYKVPKNKGREAMVRSSGRNTVAVHPLTQAGLFDIYNRPLR